MKKYKFLKIVMPNRTRYLKLQVGQVLNWFKNVYGRKLKIIPGSSIETLEFLPVGASPDVIIESDKLGRFRCCTRPDWFSR